MNQAHQLSSGSGTTAPAAVIKELSFCKTTARDLAGWLRDLPKANIGEYSRQLYMALSELSHLKATIEAGSRPHHPPAGKGPPAQ